MSELPTGAEVTVALDALRGDATIWSANADVLRGAFTAADGLRIDTHAFGPAGGDIAAGYESLRCLLAGLMSGGATNFDAVSVALTDSADAYEADDLNAVHRLSGTY